MLTVAIILLCFTVYVYSNCKQKKDSCWNDHLIKQLEVILGELKSKNVQSIESGTGEKYTRWGRTTCNGKATLVYDGFAAGNHWNEGGSGVNFLCLPKDPEWKEYSDIVEEYRSRIYGVEYEVYNDRQPYSGFIDKDMPCAVCLTDRRSTVLMLPGKATCNTGWHKEYSGYLMSQSGNNGRMPSEYICADEKLESVPGGDSSRNQAMVYPVEAICGSLKCPPYVNGRELTCVVCSR